MELRSVLTKKKNVEQQQESVLDDVAENVDVYAPEISDQITDSTVSVTPFCTLWTVCSWRSLTTWTRR